MSSPTVQGTNLYGIEYYVSDEIFSPKHQAFLAVVTSATEPQYFHEAMKDKRWKKAMSHEIDALEENKTWDLEDLPPGKKALGCRWI